jgi:hypothetical protein
MTLVDISFIIITSQDVFPEKIMKEIHWAGLFIPLLQIIVSRKPLQIRTIFTKGIDSLQDYYSLSYNILSWNNFTGIPFLLTFLIPIHSWENIINSHFYSTAKDYSLHIFLASFTWDPIFLLLNAMDNSLFLSLTLQTVTFRTNHKSSHEPSVESQELLFQKYCMVKEIIIMGAHLILGPNIAWAPTTWFLFQTRTYLRVNEI